MQNSLIETFCKDIAWKRTKRPIKKKYLDNVMAMRGAQEYEELKKLQKELQKDMSA